MPYIDTTELKEGQNYPQPEPKEMYRLIEQDLRQAVNLLPTKNQMKLNFNIKPNGRATKGAAQAILARVIMMQIGFGYNGKTWQEVYDLASDIIKSGQYALVSNYAQIFTLEGEQSVESVLEIEASDFNQGWGGLGGNIQQIMCSPRLTVSKQNSGKNIVSGWGFQLPTQDLYNAFEADDPRLPNTIIKSGDIIYEDGNPATDEKIIIDEGSAQCPTGYFNRKAVLPPPGPSCNICSNLNKRLVRYAEVLLTAAEAAYHLGKEDEARMYVNMVRERARNSSGPKGSQLGNADYPARNTNANVLPPVTATGTALLDAIKHERRVELAMEGHRLWDLIRWGDYEKAIETYVTNDVLISSVGAETVKANYRSHLIDGKVPTLPIPRNEVLNYGVKQNPGYPAN
ncbi:MAG: RagB/SusD family nutrient uptake outer membrane protein [Bacteroidales bacterium]